MALGYFDGVHLGHQQVILTAKNTAAREGVKTAVMTFHPHPSAVLKKGREPKDLITPLQDKISIIEDLGVDFYTLSHLPLNSLLYRLKNLSINIYSAFTLLML